MAGRFRREVVAQVERLGGDAERADDEVSRLLSLAGAGDEPAPLPADLLLVSVLFQNIDLLYTEGHPAADRIARFVMDAIHEMGGGEA